MKEISEKAFELLRKEIEQRPKVQPFFENTKKGKTQAMRETMGSESLIEDCIAGQDTDRSIPSRSE